MHEVIDLTELTTSQLESALTIGEGFTPNSECDILEVGNHKVLHSIYVLDAEGVVRALPTEVKFEIVLKDKMEETGELETDIFVKVTAVGIVANY